MIIHCWVTETEFDIEVEDAATDEEIDDIANDYISDNIGATWTKKENLCM